MLPSQRARLRDLVQHNLRAVRDMLLRELLDHFCGKGRILKIWIGQLTKADEELVLASERTGFFGPKSE